MKSREHYGIGRRSVHALALDALPCPTLLMRRAWFGAVGFFFFAGVAIPSEVSAQSAPRVSGSVGVQWLSSAGSTDLTANGPADAAAMFGEVAVRVGRVEAGVDVTNLGTRRGTFSFLSGTYDSVATDRAVLGTVRLGVLHAGRVAIAVTGGAGVHRIHQIGVFMRSQPASPPLTDIYRVTYFAMGAGGDAMIPVVRHLALVTRFRLYGLRSCRTTGFPEDLPCGMRARVSLGTGARLAW